MLATQMQVAKLGVTSTYVCVSLHQIAAALAALTGEPHPLATRELSPA